MISEDIVGKSSGADIQRVEGQQLVGESGDLDESGRIKEEASSSIVELSVSSMFPSTRGHKDLPMRHIFPSLPSSFGVTVYSSSRGLLGLRKRFDGDVQSRNGSLEGRKGQSWYFGLQRIDLSGDRSARTSRGAVRRRRRICGRT